MNLKNVDEKRLIEGAQQGDEKAWSLLVKRYTRVIWGATSGFGFSNADRENIVQEVFIKLIEVIDTYDPAKALFITFLSVITKSKCIDLQRKQKGKIKVIFNSEILKEKINSSDESGINSYQDEVEILNIIMEELNAAQKLVISLHYLKELSYEEISELVNQDKTWVKNQLYNARKRLKKLLREKKT